MSVLTPVDPSSMPEPQRGLTILPEDAALPVTDEQEVVEPAIADSDLPEELKPKGLKGFLTGRISVKIVAPFIVVMAVMAILGSFVVLNLVTGSLADRFKNQLLDAGKNVNDGIIKIEGQQLELLRLMTNTDGVDVALENGDAPALQKLLVPLQANSTFSFVDVINPAGAQVLALRPNDPNFVRALDPNVGSWDITQKSLHGDSDQFGNKWSELIDTAYGPMLYTAGPVVDSDNQIVGAILIGLPVNDLIPLLTKDVLAVVTFYTPEGKVIRSSLDVQEGDAALNLDKLALDQVFGSDPQTIQRPISFAGQAYMELVGGLVVRDKVAGGLGVAIPTNQIDSSGARTRLQLTVMFTLVTFAILVLGIIIAKRITTPIKILVDACQRVARGEFEQKVAIKNKDETGVLAHTVNTMMDGLSERDRIRDTFGRYMSQQVSDAILKGDVKLGGETRELTMLMSDIRSFTTLSETMRPDDLVAFLNRYFGQMIDCVLAHDGVVDKYMGDAILVVYGAPVRDAEHPINAVLTALDMRERMIVFNEEIMSLGHKPIRIGIGVNTGPAVTGNIGSEQRMEYTVIGDTVNATQRTEDLTKELKTDVLISETTAARLDGRFILGEPHRIILRGRTQESMIFPVIGLREGAAELWAGTQPLALGEAPRSVEELEDVMAIKEPLHPGAAVAAG